MVSRMVLALVIVFGVGISAQETVTLTNPITKASRTKYTLDRVTLDVFNERIDIALKGDDDTAHTPATHAAIAFLMGAHFVDLSTTMYVIGKCGYGCETRDGQILVASEQNPRLAPYQHNPTRFALAKYGYALGQVAGIYLLHRQHPKAARVMAYIAGGVTLAVALNNQRLLDSTR